jgi:hypothetical protein
VRPGLEALTERRGKIGSVSDRKTLEAMLDRAGIVWTLVESVERAGDAAVVLEIEAKAGPKNLGYGYFVSRLGFDEDGSLVNWGCWE